jgi:ring-1,2-phenylacetyl-CoA epoxidase subunit PaaE
VRAVPGGAFSERVVPGLRPGDRVEVLPPAGRFVAVPDPGRRASYVAVAGGAGITPLLAIVTALLEGEPGSCVTLFCVDRTSASVMFLDELHDLKDRFTTRFQLVHVLTRERQEAALLSGRPDPTRFAALLDAFVDADAVDEWFLCGPQVMVLDLREHLVRRGAERVHVELFHADPLPAAPRRRRPPSGARGCEVTVRLDGRSTDLVVPAEGPTVLEAAAAVREDVPFACRSGVCGTCRARVLEGEVEMDRNYALEPAEVASGYVLTCQARPASRRVVLDYNA